MIRFRQRKALSSVVGGIFMVLLMAGAVNLTIWSLQQQDNVTSTIIQKANSSFDKFNEKIAIASVKVNGNKLNVTVSNSGGAASHLRAIYIVNQSSTPNPTEYRYTLDNVVDGRASLANIGQSQNIIATPKANYNIRVVSDSGAMASAQLVSISKTPLQMAAYLIPPTATTGSNVTLMFTVTNNSTANGLEETISPNIQTSLSCVAGPSCSLTPKITPAGGLTLGSGATAIFKSVYYVAAPDKTSMTFNASIVGAAKGNYVIEKGVVQLINSTETSFYSEITNQTRIVLSQSLGSFQIEFKSLGMIRYTATQTLNGVAQNGWNVNFTSAGGRGYPAFYLPDSQPTILTVKMRNEDPSGQDLTLYKNTVLTFSLAGQNNNQSPPAYICYVDEKTNTIYPYNERGQYKVVIPNALKYGSNYTQGWVNIYFCASSAGTTTAWSPGALQSTDVTPVFMVVRGAFTNIYTEYGQTLPYQAVALTSSSFSACLKNSAVTCSSGSSTDKYQGSVGDTVYVSISSGSPYNTTAIWINPDGTTIPLFVNKSTNPPYTFTVPNVVGGGRYYGIQVTDTNYNIYSMTFKVN
jgi:hypothetical protein